MTLKNIEHAADRFAVVYEDQESVVGGLEATLDSIEAPLSRYAINEALIQLDYLYKFAEEMFTLQGMDIKEHFKKIEAEDDA